MNAAKAVAHDKDYQELVVGNPDQQAVEKAMATIIDKVVRQMRRSDMSLYKSYQQDEGFKDDFRSVVTRMLGDAFEVPGYKGLRLRSVEDDREVRNLIYQRLLLNNTTSDNELVREVFEVFGERYPLMDVLDWTRIIRDYAGMVREANREKDIITGMAADGADFKQP